MSDTLTIFSYRMIVVGVLGSKFLLYHFGIKAVIILKYHGDTNWASVPNKRANVPVPLAVLWWTDYATGTAKGTSPKRYGSHAGIRIYKRQWSLQKWSSLCCRIDEILSEESRRNWKKITRRIRHNSLSKAKSALLYRQFHLPVSCDLRCHARFWEISIREIQRNQRLRTRGVSPCGTRCISPIKSLWLNISDTDI